MTIEDAYKMIDSFWDTQVHDEDDEFEYVEALSFLIEEQKDPRRMMQLGGFYYGKREFDLALKYYDMAADMGYEEAYECLGYVWYYGRTGTKDYEKAFKYFKKAADRGNIVAKYKIADMYKNGYFVEQDYEEYKKIIRGLYPLVKKAQYLDDPLPEIFTRLAHIEAKEGNSEFAVKLYLKAKHFLAQRISYNPFFGNLNIMKWLIEDLYKLIDTDPSEMDLFDLYYWLNEPHTVTFRFKGKHYSVSSVNEDGEMHIKFEDKWYISKDDFFKKAMIKGRLLTEAYAELDDFRLES